MLNAFMKQRGKLYIGDKPVEVKPITIAQWKRLFEAVENLPSLILDVLFAPKADRAAFFVVAVERSFDEIVQIISVLTGIDEEYIENNASLNDLIEYFAQMAKVNDFNAIAKNIKSVLALTTKGLASSESAETKDSN